MAWGFNKYFTIERVTFGCRDRCMDFLDGHVPHAPSTFDLIRNNEGVRERVVVTFRPLVTMFKHDICNIE
jgi:hypothetical protein